MWDLNVINQMKNYAELNNVPIMTESGIRYLIKYITKNNVKRVLEIGTAIGYSAIMMCTADPELMVTISWIRWIGINVVGVLVFRIVETWPEA